MLKYLARVPADGRISVGLVEAPRDTVLGSLDGPENAVVFRTREYDQHPLTVAGPGAGQMNTAMGVVSDILKAART